MTTSALIAGEQEIASNIIVVSALDRICFWSNNTRAYVYIWALNFTICQNYLYPYSTAQILLFSLSNDL